MNTPTLHWSFDIELGDYVVIEHPQRLGERPQPLVGAANRRAGSVVVVFVVVAARCIRVVPLRRRARVLLQIL